MKPDPLHVTCINDGSGEEDENKRKGNCPDGTILDPKEGPQNPTAEAKDLKCALDDEKDCKPPKLPETRPNGKENDASFIPKCFDADESDTKCDEKQQYVEVTAGSDGKAKKTCKPTRQYENKKKNRLQKMKDKFKQRWEEKKEERAKKDEERKGRESKIEEGRKKKEKEGEDRKKMRSKLAKCSMAAVLEKGQEVAGLIPQKRDLVKRDGGNSEVESYMDMTACYFDAEFVENDEFLDYWPSDINVDDIGIGVVSFFKLSSSALYTLN
jgi:hypothetical protein